MAQELICDDSFVCSGLDCKIWVTSHSPQYRKYEKRCASFNANQFKEDSL